MARRKNFTERWVRFDSDGNTIGVDVVSNDEQTTIDRGEFVSIMARAGWSQAPNATDVEPEQPAEDSSVSPVVEDET